MIIIEQYPLEQVYVLRLGMWEFSCDIAIQPKLSIIEASNKS